MEESDSDVVHRETARKKLVKRDPQVLKVQDALEHVLVAGAKVRRDDWRRQEFERRYQNANVGVSKFRPSNDSDEVSNDKSRRRKRPRHHASAAGICHAEDFRIYQKSEESFSGEDRRSENGQKQRQKQSGDEKRISDSEWNVEYGDSVPPILFRMARLSQEYPSEEQIRMFNDPMSSRMKSLQSTDITISEKEVPRALIERCWERAVHAASNVMITPVMTATATAPPASRDHGSQNLHLLFDMNTPLSQELCRKKCESLGVDIVSLRQKSSSIAEAVSLRTDCPRCSRSFQTHDELLLHYYGNNDTRGCCRPLIRPKHLELIRNILQSHVQSQTDQLLNVILSQAETENSNRKGSDEAEADESASSTSDSDSDGEATKQRKGEQHPVGWDDVRCFLTNVVEDSIMIPDARLETTRHSVQQSIRTAEASVENEGAKAQGPLILNQMILEAVNRRLIDRYANVPR